MIYIFLTNKINHELSSARKQVTCATLSTIIEASRVRELHFRNSHVEKLTLPHGSARTPSSDTDIVPQSLPSDFLSNSTSSVIITSIQIGFLTMLTSSRFINCNLLSKWRRRSDIVPIYVRASYNLNLGHIYN